MASLKQMQKVAELTDEGWFPVDTYTWLAPEDRPIGGPVLMLDGHGRIAQVGADGVLRELVPDTTVVADDPVEENRIDTSTNWIYDRFREFIRSESSGLNIPN